MPPATLMVGAEATPANNCRARAASRGGSLSRRGRSGPAVVVLAALTGLGCADTEGRPKRAAPAAATPPGQKAETPWVTEERRLYAHDQKVTALAVSPGGTLLASAAADGKVKLWSLPDGKWLQTLPAAAPVTALAVGSDGDVLASATRNRITLRTVADGKPVKKTLEAQDGPVVALAVSRDGKWLASAGRRTIQLWELPEGKPRRTWAGHNGPITAAAVTPDGKRLVTASKEDWQVRSWSLPAGQPLESWSSPDVLVQALALTPEGTLLAANAPDNVAKLRAVPGKKVLQTLEMHTNSVEALALNDDGRYVATGDLSGIVLVWDRAAGQTPLGYLSDPASSRVYKIERKYSDDVASAKPAGPIPLMNPMLPPLATQQPYGGGGVGVRNRPRPMVGLPY